MTPETEVQLKVLAMQNAGGEITKANELFIWLAEPLMEAEVRRRVDRILTQVAANSNPATTRD